MPPFRRRSPSSRLLCAQSSSSRAGRPGRPQWALEARAASAIVPGAEAGPSDPGARTGGIAMSCRYGPRRALVIVSTLLLACAGAAEEPKKPAVPLSLTELSQEVAALQVLYALDLTRPQLLALKKVAQETAAKPARRSEGEASEQF